MTISSFGYFKGKNIKKVIMVVETSPRRLHFLVTEKSCSFRYELDALLIEQIESGRPSSEGDVACLNCERFCSF